MIVILYTQTHQQQFDVDTCANSIFELGQNSHREYLRIVSTFVLCPHHYTN